jgi:hypothetical protein
VFSVSRGGCRRVGAQTGRIRDSDDDDDEDEDDHDDDDGTSDRRFP